MLAIIPIFMFLATFLYLLGLKQGERLSASDWRGTFLQACLVWGLLVVVFSEFLSLFNALTLPWLAAFWALALVLILLLGWRRNVFPRAWTEITQVGWQSIGWFDGLLFTGLAAIALVLFVVAWKSPPNNTDSMHYHMSRVVHWAQNMSLKHYATYFEPQLWNPIWAETAILNLRVLWGNDRLANLVQWFSMVGSWVGVSALADLLGAKRRGQLVAVAFTASIPMGILQATSTQNDYVTAFWLVCLIYFVLLSKSRSLESFEWLSLALATGLGMLTKGTFYPYAFPILLWFFIPYLVKQGLRRTFLAGIGFAGFAIVLNFGFWARNTLTYGGPLGPGDWITSRTEVRLTPNSWISGVLKQTALNFVTPSNAVNYRIITAVESLHEFLNIDIGEFELIWSWNHEDLAGNPLHFLSVPFVLAALLFIWRRKESKLALGYAFIVLASFVVYSVVVAFDNYGVRYHLPFFVLWSGAIGAAASLTRLRKLANPAATLLLLTSLPWLLLNRSRPIVDLRPRTMTSSIFDEPPAAVLFANWTNLRKPYLKITEDVIATGCQEVGLRIDSHDLEYPYWWLLDAPQSGIRLEVVDTYPHLERYLDQDFKPCAIICSVCGDLERLYGLRRQGDFGEGIVLFTGSDFVPSE